MHKIINFLFFKKTGNIALISLCLTRLLFAESCPDPQNSCLQWGEIPPPWEASPFSALPQGDQHIQFRQASILVAGVAQGIACSYHSPSQDYVIWRPGLVKFPDRKNANWIESPNGWICTTTIEQCQFNIRALA